MHRLTIAITAAMIPGLATADSAWWHGVWATENSGCAAGDRITFSEHEVAGYRNGCAVTFVQKAQGADAVRLTLACDDQEDHYEEDHTVLKDGTGTIWMQAEDGERLHLVRCD